MGAFHDHLDRCRRCQDQQPCEEGYRLLRKAALERQFDDSCAFCGHMLSDHDFDSSYCRGKPIDPSLDASGECPCNGFLPRVRN
jgi:hypothetical protein